MRVSKSYYFSLLLLGLAGCSSQQETHTFSQGQPSINQTTSQASGQSITEIISQTPPHTTPPTPLTSIPAAWKTAVDAGMDKLQNAELAASAELGYVYRGANAIWDYGSSSKNSIFEIGSVSKSFTGTMLAEEVLEGLVSLDGTVDQYLPEFKGTFTGGITLRELATHTSGLSRMPCVDPTLSYCFHPADSSNPYIDYSWTQLENYLLQYAPSGYDPTAPRPTYPNVYSNTGFGLLGYLITKMDGAASFEALLIKRITGPLGMVDTRVNLNAEQKTRLIDGFDITDQLTPHWDFDVMAPTGGIRSSASDMMIYVQANLNSDSASELSALPSLAKAMTLSQAEGLGWDSLAGDKVVWKDGETGGFAATIIIEKSTELGILMLGNLANSPDESTVMALPFGKVSLADEAGLPLDSTALENYVGNYICGNSSVVVSLSGKYLSADSQLFNRSTMRASSATDFALMDGFYYPGFNTLSFVEDASGKANGLVLHLKDDSGNARPDQNCQKL